MRVQSLQLRGTAANVVGSLDGSPPACPEEACLHCVSPFCVYPGLCCPPSHPILITFPWAKQVALIVVAAAAKSLQTCPTLCDPIDGSPPGSPDPGILQARTLKWVAISFSKAWKWKVKVKSLSHVQLLATPGLQPTRLLHPWDSSGKSTGVGCHCTFKYDI